MLKESGKAKFIARKEELTLDLMEKMMSEMTQYSESKQYRILFDRKDLFDALPIIDSLMKNDLINNKTNNEVYEFYLIGCKGLKLTPMSKENLGKYLCKWFDFTINSKRTGDGIVRVYKQIPVKPKFNYRAIDIEAWRNSTAQAKKDFCEKYSRFESDTLTSNDYKLMIQFLLKK